MAEYKNTISILLTAQDEASAVIKASAAQVEEAQAQVAVKTVEAQETITASNERTAASAEASATATAAASREQAAAVDESAAQIDASNAMIIAGFNAVAGSADEKLSTTGGLAALGIAAAVGAAAYEMVKAAGNFQQSMTRLVTSAGESESNLAMVSAGVLQVAQATGTSVAALAQAMYIVESGGQHGAAGLEVLKAAAQGAKTENADLVTVADAVTSAMTDYHLPASQAADVTSKLVAATGQGKTTFQDLAGAMSAILPKASAAHISLDEILGDLASMTLHGISAQQAAENMADAISHLQSPTQAMSKELASLGLNSTELSQNLGTTGLTGTIQEISKAIEADMGAGTTAVVLNMEDALQGLPASVQQVSQEVINGTATWQQWNVATKGLTVTQRAQAEAFATLYNGMHTIGTEQMTGAQVMQTYAGAMAKATGDSASLNVALMLSGQNMDNTTRAIKAVTSATADASGNVRGWTDIQKNFNQQMSVLKEDIVTTAISIGSALLPALTDIAKALIAVLSPVIRIIGHFKDLFAGLMILVAGFTSYIAITWATEAAMGALGTAFGEVATSLIDLSVDLVAFQAAIGPIGWAIEALILAIAVATYEIVTHWTTVKDWIKKFWEDNENYLIVFGAFFFPVITSIAYAADEIITHWGRIENFFQHLWGDLKNEGSDISQFFTGLWTNPGQAAHDFIQTQEDAFKRLVDDMGHYGTSMTTRLSTGLKSGFSVLTQNAPRWGQEFAHAYEQGLEKLAEFDMTEFFNLDSGGSMTALKKMGDAYGRAIIEGIKDALTGNFGAIGRLFTSLPALIAGQVKDSGKSVADAHINAIESEFTSVAKMQELGKDILKGVGLATAGIVAAVALLAIAIGLAIINGINDGIRMATHLLTDEITGLWTYLRPAFDQLGTDIRQWAEEAVSEIVDAFIGLPGKVQNALSSSGSSFVKDIGHDLHIPGFATGTSYAPGGLATLGENGAELVTGPTTGYLPQGSQVLTADETRSALGAGSGGKVVIEQLNINNNVDAGLVVRQIGWQLANAS